jgi:hypothetical protein
MVWIEKNKESFLLLDDDLWSIYLEWTEIGSNINRHPQKEEKDQEH